MKRKKESLVISAFYFFLFFGYGVYSTMVGFYLKQEQFSGFELGILLSISPLLLLFFQPLWGLLTDYTQKPRLILCLSSVLLAGIVFLIPSFHQFVFVLSLMILYSVFHSAINPVSDRLVIQYAHQQGKCYGDYRLWGAISFALGAWLMGEIGDQSGALEWIFYLHALSLGVVALLSMQFPSVKVLPRENRQIWRDIRILFRIPAYWIFLTVSFCLLGPIMANNHFFALFYQFIGGTLAGVGVCFLIGAGSEAPFMRFAGGWIRRLGYQPVLLSSAFLLMVQYFSYAIALPADWIPWVTALQGFSVGLFIPASLQMISQLAPPTVQTTAIAVYNAMGYGVGNWFFALMGGWLLDFFPVTGVYWFFTIFVLIGFVLMTGLSFKGSLKDNKKRHHKI